MKLKGQATGFALRILCAALLLFLGFAHRTTVAVAADMSAYTLPDGSIPVICLPGTEDGKSGKHVDRGCEACRIASAFALPDAASEPDNTSLVRESVSFAFGAERFHRLIFPPSAPPRGPPSFPVSFETA